MLEQDNWGGEDHFVACFQAFLRTELNCQTANDPLQELCNAVEHLGRYPYLIDPNWTDCRGFDGVIPLSGLHTRWATGVKVRAMLWTIDQACMPLEFEAHMDHTQSHIRLGLAFGDASVPCGTCQSEREIYRCFVRDGGPKRWRYAKTWEVSCRESES